MTRYFSEKNSVSYFAICPLGSASNYCAGVDGKSPGNGPKPRSNRDEWLATATGYYPDVLSAVYKLLVKRNFFSLDLMKWSFILHQKLKAAGLLLSLMLIIQLTATSLKNEVQDMEQTVVGLYTDRLQPAVDLVYISESLHAKRLVLGNQFMMESPLQPGALASQLGQYDQQIGSRIGQYEKTKLTTDEVIWLRTFKKNWAHGKRVEQSIQQLMASGQRLIASQLFNERGATLFKQSVQSVHKLAQIQAETGQRAVKEAHRMAAGGSLNVTLLIAISLIVGLVILGLIHNARLLSQKSQSFYLN